MIGGSLRLLYEERMPDCTPLHPQILSERRCPYSGPLCYLATNVRNNFAGLFKMMNIILSVTDTGALLLCTFNPTGYKERITEHLQ